MLLLQILSVQQLYRICTLYWDDNYNTRSVSTDVSPIRRRKLCTRFWLLIFTSTNEVDVKIFRCSYHLGHFEHEDTNDWGLERCCQQFFSIGWQFQVKTCLYFVLLTETCLVKVCFVLLTSTLRMQHTLLSRRPFQFIASEGFLGCQTCDWSSWEFSLSVFARVRLKDDQAAFITYAKVQKIKYT